MKMTKRMTLLEKNNYLGEDDNMLGDTTQES
jgi:hypothetical protein